MSTDRQHIGPTGLGYQIFDLRNRRNHSPFSSFGDNGFYADLVHQRMEFQLRKQRSQPHRVTFPRTKRVEIQLDRHVLADSHQIPTQPCDVGIGEQRLASTFALYLRCVLEN